ncbi:acyltransferase [Gilvimarinus sp. SDUM040013]|uniref:Acyltransferase n=1 Tax=Gilvimarinus gilvus TaxID=3058038 RepID=A0ABU4S6W9_9GAMM|nr:acyltransferase [Gilvimarinus sp. SDUM040013]MDO3385491.1 acyltransferase [Gilvimarinus sp. SDUM040013]MDX6851274.1 acyltransferase [Gilvimarinus sp. SDUM040013]
MATLDHFSESRQNNFTALRLLFAWMVLYGHGFSIHGQGSYRDPLNSLWQGSLWTGELAVLGFFCISGFLVCKSLNHRRLSEFLQARALRIIPGLLVCTLITVLILGPLLTNVPLSEYFTQTDTFRYLGNGLGFLPIQWHLPGLFTENRLDVVNGSLWTLPVEWFCYLLLALLGYALVRLPLGLANVFLILIALCVGVFLTYPGAELGISLRWRLPCLYFCIGVAIYTNRKFIPLHGAVAIVMLAAFIFAKGTRLDTYLSAISLPYLIVYLAYGLPSGSISEKLSDASYGIYIYAWPVQQFIEQTLTPSPWLGMLYSTPLVVTLALASWHFIERPMLQFRPASSKMTLNPNESAQGSGK